MEYGVIPDRRGQVWQKTWENYAGRKTRIDTLLVISKPLPLKDSSIKRLFSSAPIWLKYGWFHQVIEIESGYSVDINEMLFQDWTNQDSNEKPVCVRIT
jgi:hypothetical protein